MWRGSTSRFDVLVRGRTLSSFWRVVFGRKRRIQPSLQMVIFTFVWKVNWVSHTSPIKALLCLCTVDTPSNWWHITNRQKQWRAAQRGEMECSESIIIISGTLFAFSHANSTPFFFFFWRVYLPLQHIKTSLSMLLEIKHGVFWAQRVPPHPSSSNLTSRTLKIFSSRTTCASTAADSSCKEDDCPQCLPFIVTYFCFKHGRRCHCRT